MTDNNIHDNLGCIPDLAGDNFGPADLGTPRRFVLLNFISAGAFMEATDMDYPAGYGDEIIEHCAKAGPRAFALRVQGDSMEPRFYNNDIIIVDPDIEPQNGDFVVAKLRDSGEATFKKLVRNGRVIMLRPLNPKYPDIVIDDAGAIAAFYKVVAFSGSF